MLNYEVSVSCANYGIEASHFNNRHDVDKFVDDYSVDGWNGDLQQHAKDYGVWFEIWFKDRVMSSVHRSFK
jgi:hypothetical protein